MKYTGLQSILVTFVLSCGAFVAIDPNALEQAKGLMKKDNQSAALTLLEQYRSQSDTPWLYTQEMAKLLFYQLRQGVSVFDEDSRGDVFSANADQAVTLFEQAIQENPQDTYESWKLLAYLLYDRDEYPHAAKVLSDGLQYFGDDEDFYRQYCYLNEKMATVRYRPWVYGIAALLTVMIAYRIYTTYRAPQLSTELTQDTIPTDQEIVLESTMKNTKWGLLMLACAWLITIVLGPSSLAASVYSKTLSGRLMEGFMVGCALLFFCSAFLFFGKKVLTFQSNGNVVLREVGLLGRAIDWQVLGKDLAHVVTQKADAYVYMYGVPRSIACTQVLLQDQTGRSYPVLQTPNKQEAQTLAQSLGRTLNVPVL